ncbi:MAG: ABC transporter permease, partial [Carnobacterium sp.]|nr:ABC transporter permease [Carnobacterium sp.]
MNLIVTATSQGLLWGVMALGIFITFRILDLPDMTAEGSFPLGAAVCAKLILSGVHPIVATLVAFISGMLAGAITGFLITKCNIPGLLAGILTMTGLYS